MLRLSFPRSRLFTFGKNRKLYLSSQLSHGFFVFLFIVIRSYPYCSFFTFSVKTYDPEVRYPSAVNRFVLIRSSISDRTIGYERISSISEFFSFAENSIVFGPGEIIDTLPRKFFTFSFVELFRND